MAAPEGMSVGQNIAFGDNVSLKPGNVTTLAQIPEGTPVCNVELRPGDGGKLARSGGNSALLETRMGDKVRVRLPSGRLKELHSKCRATIGVLAGHGRTEKPLMKAGAAHYRAKARGKLYPTVSGVAMNPVDHPHGGGNHQAVHGPNSVSRNAPPGQKVGHIAPRRNLLVVRLESAVLKFPSVVRKNSYGEVTLFKNFRLCLFTLQKMTLAQYALLH